MDSEQELVDIGWRHLDMQKFYCLMPLGSMLIRTLIFPLGLIKTRLQSTAYNYKGGFDAVSTIVRTEGVRALYQGFLTNSLTVIVGPVYVTALELTKHHYLLLNERHQFVSNPWLSQHVV